MTDTTQTIAVIAGAYLLVTGIGFLVSTSYYERMTAMGNRSDPVLINLSGAVHLVVGLIILNQHFLWSSVAEGAVTLVGLMAAVKGAVLIIVPEAALKAGPQSAAAIRRTGAAFMVAGLFLLLAGFRLI